MFNPVNPKQSFPKLEEEILRKWEKSDVFRQSIKNRKNSPEFVFYDGPPFATGLPHYGHILGGVIKDLIPRYKTMKGFRVERRFGWDCHGLPVENLIEKELNLPDKKALEDYGIGNFNEACRSSVLRYTEEWGKTVNRMGRWVDFENSYKTMDKDFMESIWRVFKELWKKDLVYQGHKPMHVCPRCVTPLSNFEVTQGYQDLTDLSVTTKFKVNKEKSCNGKEGCCPSGEIYFLAWTTTPWTLPGNVALALGAEIEYSLIKRNGECCSTYILATEAIPRYLQELGGEGNFEVVGKKLGKEIVSQGVSYEPLFPYFEKENGAFKVVIGDFVTTDSGTGIVHIAPAFGEDDLNLAKKEELPFVQHVKMDGYFTEEVTDFQGVPVKEKSDCMKMDRKIVEFLEVQNKVFQKKTLRHSYPCCWRCDTPLLNYATSSWFVKVEDLKDKLLANNEKINWTPSHLKDGRFGKWLEGARDWAISRNRYWGTPLPIWQNEVSGNFYCVASVSELEKLTGEKISDLHKHFVDELEFTIDGEEGVYKKIPEVFDCWFESGSMPYAQKHFPFEEKIVLKNDYYLLRHGEAHHNTEGTLNCTDFREKNGLTEEGKKQVTESAKNFGEKVDLIFHSPLERTTETAKILQKFCGGELIVDERLKETNFGEFNGKKGEEWTNWKKQNDWSKEKPEGGETLTDILDRTFDFISEVNEKYEGKKIAFVSHAGILKFLRKNVNGEKLEKEDYTGKSLVPTGQIFPLTTGFKLPADFIAEGLDQTRGWFYTLHVLSTALFDKPAFENVVVNGIVLAEDGKKMSKSLKNYPDPQLIFDQYGADAMRFYLMNSPVVAAENLRFSEKGVEEVVKSVLLPLWNSYSFFVTYANIDGVQVSEIEEEKLTDLDKWILSELEILTKEVTEKMDNYNLSGASRLFPKFFDNITNWYIRRSRKRFWSKAGGEDQVDKQVAYNTLYKVLLDSCKLLAPFCPFVSEEIFQNLKKSEKFNSIHLQSWPEFSEKFIDKKLSQKIATTQEVISLGLALRKKLKIKVRQPLQKALVLAPENLISDQIETIKEELNIKEIEFLKNPEEIAELSVVPNAKILGPKFGAKMQKIIREAKSGNFKKLENGNLEVCGEELIPQEIELRYQGKGGKEVNAFGELLVSLDTEITEELKLEGLARDLIRQIAEMRKEAGYKITDRISVEIDNPAVCEKFGELINQETLSSFAEISDSDLESEVEGMKVKIKK